MRPSKLLLQMQNEYPDQEVYEVFQDGRSIGLVREGSGEWIFWPRGPRRFKKHKGRRWICSNPELETREEAEKALRRYVRYVKRGKKDMDIQIKSRAMMISDMLLDKALDRNVVSINDNEKEVAFMECRGRKSCLDIHISRFSDVKGPIDDPSIIVPTHEHVKSILEWAEAKGDAPFTIHCHAGVSRSSAIAYLIAAQMCGDADEAIKILDYKFHGPNTRIVRLGAEILGHHRLIDVLAEWCKENRRRKQEERKA